MKYKYLNFVVLLLIFFFAFNCEILASGIDDIIEEQKEIYGYNDINNLVPNSAYDTAEEFGEDLSIDNVNNFLDIGKILNFLLSKFINAISGNGSLFIGLIIILFASLFVKILNENGKSDIIKILNVFIMISSSLILFNGIFKSIENLNSSINILSSFSTSLIPVLSSLIAASGRPTYSISGASTTFFAIEFLLSIITYVIIPFSNVYIAMGVGAGLSSNQNIKKLSTLIKNWSIGIYSFICCLFIGVLSIQSLLTSSGDDIARKTLKHAAGSFLPVAGGYLSEGIDTIYTCASNLKNTSGIFAIIVVFLIIISPLIDMLCKYIIIRISEIICNIFNNEILVSFFGIARDTFSILTSVILGYSMMIIISISILLI